MHGPAVRERIDVAARSGATELVFTGGEPTLRRDLADLIAHAKAQGVERTLLETNGANIDAARARHLAAAGLDAARVHLPGWEHDHERVTRAPGSFPAVLAAMESLVAADISLSVSIPLVAATKEHAAGLPARLTEAGLRPRPLLLVVPSDTPEPGHRLSLPEAATLAVAVDQAGQRVGLVTQLSPDTLIPPCSFERPRQSTGLFTLTPGAETRDGYARTMACTGCVLEERCPGVPRAYRVGEAAFEPKPVKDDGVRRRLSVISSVDDQIRRELVSRELERAPDGSARPAHTIRINFRCNQACDFCFVSTHLPAAPDDEIRAAIEEISSIGGALVLSGGEPTLNPSLVDYVKLGHRLGATVIELQTNATRLADPAAVAALEEAGVTVAHISLHACTSEISDGITGAPGTFDKTVLGIDTLHASNIRARLNFVFCESNYRQFPEYVDYVHQRWPDSILTVSFIAQSTDVVPRGPIMPRYSDIAGSLAAGLRRAAAHEHTVSGFDSMCGLPLCVVPDDLSHLLELAEIPEGSAGEEFVRPDACSACTMKTHCFGVRRGYADAYGLEEFTAI